MKKITKRDLHPAESQAAEVVIGWDVPGSGADVSGLRELTTPPILKMEDMPVGARIDGKLLDVLPSRDKSIKNPLFVLALTKNGQKVTVPGQAAITNNLLVGFDADNQAHRENPVKFCPHLGARIVIEKAGHKLSKKWEEKPGKPRRFAVYNIYVDGPAPAPAPAAAPAKGKRK